MSSKTTQHPYNIVGVHKQPAWARLLLLFVLAYEGLGGVAGGLMLIIKPDGQLIDMPVEMIHGAFIDFLIPGIILTTIAILSLIAFYAVLRKNTSDWLIASISLITWICWFVTEIIIIRELHWLHIMWAAPVLWGVIVAIPLIRFRNNTASMEKGLLYAGIISSIWYFLINIIVPMQYENYDISSYTPSELSAVGAPTRILWVLLVIPYTLLFAAFGWGLITIQKTKIQIIAYLIIAYSLFNTYWPPMHMRGETTTLNDTLHLVWAAITVFLMILMMVIGATAFNKSFRFYSFISIALHIIFGILTSMEAPNIPIDGPTPTIGIWERINIAIFMIWVVVFAKIILQQQHTSAKFRLV